MSQQQPENRNESQPLNQNNQSLEKNKSQNNNFPEQNESQNEWLPYIMSKLKQVLTSKTTLKSVLMATSLFAALYAGRSAYKNIMPITEVLTKMSKQEFSRVVVWGTFIVCYLKTPVNGSNYFIATKSIMSDEQISARLAESQTQISSPLLNEVQIFYALMGCAYSYAVYKIVMSMRDPHKFAGKQKKDMINEQKVKDFSHVGGCIEAKNALKDIIDCVHNPNLYASAGVKMPRGVLLYGPPGTGKTLVAKAAATEAGIPVIYCSGSEFVEVFVGLGAKRVRDIFKQARQLSPCMVFIDEIDAVGFSRGNNNYIMGGGHREMETTLNELLNQMDGFEENDKIIVVAATNLAATLDPALQRPGRFDQKIEIKLPNADDRREIFKIHLKNKQHQLQDKDIEQAASQTEGLSGAEIENIVNLAALQSVRKSQSMKLNYLKLEGQEFSEFVKTYIQEKRKVSNHVGLQNAQPHHYFRQ